ncbi:MAG: FAD:protein FMN transferase [Bacteroidales bacterium]|nr:FAD:protein FMN transferase [Bacteroidales bacterium]
MIRKATILATLLLIILCTATCHRGTTTNGSAKMHITGTAQGTYYNITYYDPQGRDLKPLVDSVLHQFDLTASLWQEGSLIRRLNSNLTDTLNPLMDTMLRHSLLMWRLTDGAFDITVGNLVGAWGFGFKERSNMTAAIVDSLLALTGSQHLAVDTMRGGVARLVKDNSATEIDLNAIAQGESVDLLDRLFASMGLSDYLIDIGGEVLARGTKSGGEPWAVGIERPAPDKESRQEVEVAVGLSNLSVVTSGNYRKYYEVDGTKYSHTIDPATGRPVNHSLLSASVIDRYAWRADALATAFMVMGLERGLQFIADHPDQECLQAVFFIYNEGGEYKCLATPKFKQYIID